MEDVAHSGRRPRQPLGRPEGSFIVHKENLLMGQSREFALIQALLDRTEALALYDDNQKDALIQETRLLIRKLISDSATAADYETFLGNIEFHVWISDNPQYKMDTWNKGKGKLLNLLNTMKKELEWFPVDVVESHSNTDKVLSNKIFIVHGHDDGMKNEVARVVEKLGLEPIILHEQDDKGLTVIEKFEANADVCDFAVILLSPDDMAFKVNDDPQSAKFRARQNVILELGYFVGKLGREKVLPLVKNAPTGELEIPSDYAGVVYTPYDVSGGWKMKLFQYLRANGYTVDANKIF